MWNHALFKSLLFFAAGSVVHAANTREIDHLGGLARRMPWTALMFAVGAVAICGLPPLNGFVSELLVYLGLFNAATVGHSGSAAVVALTAPALAMVGALALACFVKAYGAVFLGTARSQAALVAHESSFSMIAPMVLLALLCAAIGLFPGLVLPLLDPVVGIWSGIPSPQLLSHVPHGFITVLSLCILLAVIAGSVALRRMLMRRPLGAAGTWDCGYLRTSSRIQYTASSFASTLVALFAWVLRPLAHRAPPVGVFPGSSRFDSHVPEVVLDGLLNPWWGRFKSSLASARVLQQGSVQRYLLYIMLALFGLLLSLVPVTELVKKLLGR